MNLNNNPEKLKREEQIILDKLIARMDQVICSLDQRAKNYVEEARNVDISVNPDLYLAQVLVQRGLKDTVENRKQVLQARDELYHTRLLLHYKDDETEGIDEIKVGLHSCIHNSEKFVISWTMPLCRHFILNNASTEFESVVKGKNGEEFHTKYTLLVKNRVKLRFTRVAEALNLFPGVFDDNTLEQIKGTGYLREEFLDELIKQFNPNEYDPDSAAKIISDEFLQELLERRSTPEFKNIVFSIQKKQGGIIQAPYNKNMIVQGCAGSGKSMIMLHRLPIILYDNPNSLNRSNLYIITPSQMYIQMAESMRHQLEISDIKMGTIEQYYDYCIDKYPGHKSGEYGKISYHARLSQDNERYIYSKECIADICGYFENICDTDLTFLGKAMSILNISTSDIQLGREYSQKLRYKLLLFQRIIHGNNVVISDYFAKIRAVLDSLYTLSMTVKHRKEGAIRNITKNILKEKGVIDKAEKEIETLDPNENFTAIENRNNTIKEAEKRLAQLQEDLNMAETDDKYFDSLLVLNEKIESVREPFTSLKNSFSQNTNKAVYDAIDKIGQLIGGFFMLSWEFLKVEDKYVAYMDSIESEVKAAQSCVGELQKISDKYLDCDYFSKIKKLNDILVEENANAIGNAYAYIMGKIGIKPNEKGTIKALKCSPYLYLQIIYQFQGISNGGLESLLSIDEAQGIAPEEIRLLSNINAGKAVLNMFGDIYQHIEGTKGIDSWDEYKTIIDFDMYEMQENYRNASQITEYCNRQFGMKMNAINTPGKGVHEIKTESEFHAEMITQLVDTQRAGLAAILVGSDAEARYMLDVFSECGQKFHDMTDEEFSMHRTRWNIMNIGDAKGLEFSSVIVLSGRMSRNERYIAYTRALDELFVYSGVIDISGYEKKTKKSNTKGNKQSTDLLNQMKSNDTLVAGKRPQLTKHVIAKRKKDCTNSEVRSFFVNKGLEVVDKRTEGGRLWVIGEKTAIRDVVNAAISQFGITGKYASSQESGFKNGWCTKTDK